MNQATLTEALMSLANALGDGITSSEVGPHLTCTEADAIARVLALAGHREAAGSWLRGHADGDETGDDHWVVTPDKGKGRAMTDRELDEYVVEVLPARI